MHTEDSPEKSPVEPLQSSEHKIHSSVDDNPPPPRTDEGDSPSTIEEQPKEKTLVPSHSPLAYSNCPPLWSPTPKTNPLPKPPQSKPQQYTSAERMKAILNTGSSSSKKSDGRFEERDPSNQHQYLQGPDRRYTHPKLNIFGRDIASPGRSSFFGGKGKKK